jgi:hypothetical protein
MRTDQNRSNVVKLETKLDVKPRRPERFTKATAKNSITLDFTEQALSTMYRLRWFLSVLIVSVSLSGLSACQSSQHQKWEMYRFDKNFNPHKVR